MLPEIKYMSTVVQDPLGHEIFIPARLTSKKCSCKYDELEEVISHPAFLIKEKKQALYCFRMLHSKLNVLVEIKKKGGVFMVDSCIENPTVEYISGLLSRGGLFCFS